MPNLLFMTKVTPCYSDSHGDFYKRIPQSEALGCEEAIRGTYELESGNVVRAWFRPLLPTPANPEALSIAELADPAPAP